MTTKQAKLRGGIPNPNPFPVGVEMFVCVCNPTNSLGASPLFRYMYTIYNTYGWSTSRRHTGGGSTLKRSYLFILLTEARTKNNKVPRVLDRAPRKQFNTWYAY